MAQILDGIPVAEALYESLKADVIQLNKNGIDPTLAIFRVGADDDSIVYESNVIKQCTRLGIDVREVIFPADTSADDFLNTLRLYNCDQNTHGILLICPLPKHIDEEKAWKLIPPEKNMNGYLKEYLPGEPQNEPGGFLPCEIQAVMELLSYYDVDIIKKQITVISKTAEENLLLAEILRHSDAEVKICHERTEETALVSKASDIVIVTSGETDSIGKDYCKKGQIVIDTGLEWNEAKQEFCGYVKHHEVSPMAKAITPVPSGISSILAAVICRNLIQTALQNAVLHSDDAWL